MIPLMVMLKKFLEERLLIKYYMIKYLLLLKIQFNSGDDDCDDCDDDDDE